MADLITDFMNRNEKVARTFLIIFGSIMTFCGLYNLFLAFVISITRQTVLITGVWLIYMPFLLLPGFGYLLLGLKFKKIRDRKFLIHLIISIITIIWLIAYIIGLILSGASPKLSLGNLESTMASIFFIFGIVFASLAILIPQYIIGLNLYKAEQKRRTDE